MSDEANSPSNGENSEAVSSDAGQVQQTEQQQQQPAQQSLALDEKPAASAREAVERAFAKIEQQPAQKPAEQTADAKPERARDETGKFVKADAKPDGKVEAKPEVKASEIKSDVAQVKAPPRFSKAAQDAWAQTPEPVRAEVERAIGELSQGIEKYRASAEAFAPVEKYHQMAVQSGTTLEKALDAYVGIETTWRQNPARGFVEVCRNMGVDPGHMLQAVAQGLQGAQQTVPQRDSQEVAALKQQVAAFEQRFGTLEKTFTEDRQKAAQTSAAQSVEAFAKDHPHFDVVANDIAQMLETGYAKDLPDAYAKAIRLNPEVSARIEAEKKPAVDPAQTREKAAKSITGSPATGSHPDATPKPAGSPREALQRAFASVGVPAG